MCFGTLLASAPILKGGHSGPGGWIGGCSAKGGGAVCVGNNSLGRIPGSPYRNQIMLRCGNDVSGHSPIDLPQLSTFLLISSDHANREYASRSPGTASARLPC
jgi:hypothetical protein